jgi:hypothetical protein
MTKQNILVFSDGDLISSKLKDFAYDLCLQSKSIHTVPNSLQDYANLKFDISHSDVHGPLAIQSHSRKRYFIMFINEFSQYIWIYFIWYKSHLKLIFKIFYNMVKTKFSAKIKKLKSNNRGKYVDINIFLEI